MKIGRVLFIFSEGDGSDGSSVIFQNSYYCYGLLLSRLLNEVYDGKKIPFLNILFATQEHYIKYPIVPLYYINSNASCLEFHGLIDFKEFYLLSEGEQVIFVWEKVYEYIQTAAKAIKNYQLVEASEYAYKKGLEINLNPDFRVVDTDIILFEQPVRASVWIYFKPDRMCSKFTLELADKLVFEKELDSTVPALEFFLVIYKKIEVKDNVVIVKGHYEVDYLPLKIYLDRDFNEIPPPQGRRKKSK
jgi:hypothetical protein